MTRCRSRRPRAAAAIASLLFLGFGTGSGTGVASTDSPVAGPVAAGVLAAAGDSLWTIAFSTTGPELSISSRPLPAPAVAACWLDRDRLAIATLSGLCLVDFAGAHEEPPVRRFLMGTPVRSLARGPQGDLFLLIREPGRARESCEVRSFSPGNRDDTHVAEVSAEARQLAYTRTDSSLWIFPDRGRVVERVVPDRSGWRRESVDLPELDQHAPPAFWKLQFIASSEATGMIVLEQGRGLIPTLLGQSPLRSLWSWPRGAYVEGGVADRSAELIVLNGVSEILLVDSFAGTGASSAAQDDSNRSWKLPTHAAALALSQDAEWLAVAMEIEPGRSRIEIRNRTTGRVTHARNLGSAAAVLEFLEPDAP